MAGRPKVKPHIDETQVAQLASFGCTDSEIAVVAGISESTLRRHFEPLLKKGRASLRADLRTAQVKKALGVFVRQTDKDDTKDVYLTPPDNTMLIWLGKQYLEQRDKTDTKTSYDPIDWDTIPPDVRDAFIAGKVSLDDIRRLTPRTH